MRDVFEYNIQEKAKSPNVNITFSYLKSAGTELKGSQQFFSTHKLGYCFCLEGKRIICTE